ncbi:sigma-54 dependent transcriptional regulator [Terriglobus roseus]|uniref:DNA-binding transcriptional response regulator, NtrC family, contains REC, AAA-type ATPase, and a Fis-type DNA-binding domains n=1 Tax=Terriglobus roseus TaxID=392734 RepID=A0A1G7IBR5_9BACT|nr:sigma-54 dependent transcriptional regulator [Terriglobus roseus]SDF10161.1 DNA-binding transcriptional response regulator, NtrC family, contains REC, AAA-type ATPase, and a Fis-type DNA-binding domains [Terriglobus roseus]
MNSVVAASVQQRSVVLVTPDTELRHKLSSLLSDMRWQVFPASGGAEAMMHLGSLEPEAMIVDHWLPDLDASEFAEYAATVCPATDMLQMDGSCNGSKVRSARRNELLHALREAQECCVERTPATGGFDGAAWLHAPVTVPFAAPMAVVKEALPEVAEEVKMHLPEFVGDALKMRELAQQIRLVAPHATANVLVLGETGTGKELVAKAVHRLSPRAGKPFVVLNCAAIPEHLLEAELFGHTRGAFTGAVSSRMGRIEAAHGGTLFLDEIGEMPLPLQAKMLRFLENGEIQKVGENEPIRVDVRIVAATHQPLEELARDRRFRPDLYYRLAVFPVEIPALRERREDIPMLVEHTLRKLGDSMPRKSISSEALSLLMELDWAGNVRELCHMVHRAVILCGEEAGIRPEHILLPGRFSAMQH